MLLCGGCVISVDNKTSDWKLFNCVYNARITRFPHFTSKDFIYDIYNRPTKIDYYSNYSNNAKLIDDFV